MKLHNLYEADENWRAKSRDDNSLVDKLRIWRELYRSGQYDELVRLMSSEYAGQCVLRDFTSPIGHLIVELSGWLRGRFLGAISSSWGKHNKDNWKMDGNDIIYDGPLWFIDYNPNAMTQWLSSGFNADPITSFMAEIHNVCKRHGFTFIGTYRIARDEEDMSRLIISMISRIDIHNVIDKIFDKILKTWIDVER